MAEYAERTEQATPRKRQKAREEGRVPRSRDLSSMAATGGIILILYMGGRHFMDSISSVTGRLLSLQYGRDPFAVMRAASVDAVLLLLPFFAAALALGVGANVATGGFLIKKMTFHFDGLNPINGIKRIFSITGLTEGLKSLAKFLVGGYIFYLVMRKEIEFLPFLMEMRVREISLESGHLIMKAIAYGFACFFTFGVIDIFLQRWQFEKSLRMSKEEIRQEMQETDGNPIIKSRIKSIQREMARRRMMQEVPKATVVITNPTHLAVALRYEDKKTAAPVIVAKGAGVIAEKIKEVAQRSSVPIMEDKPLARVLYKLELGSAIPEELYKAVARILAYIYKLRRTKA